MVKLLALIFCTLVTLAAHAAESPVTRAMRVFDFEERRLGNPEELPMHWTKVEGAAFPHYVNGRLTTDRVHGGNYSFRMDLDGGSCLYRYEPGQIPVRAGAHYRVEGFVQTTKLENSRARLSAYFTDADGHQLPKTVTHSELYAGKPGKWKKLTIELSADDPKAAWLVLEMGLLQPSQYATADLGSRTLFEQDIHGTAWFDDITVAQVPKVVMNTDRPGNIFRRSDPIRLSVFVNDRSTDDLAAKLAIFDATGKLVHQRDGTMDISKAETVSPGVKKLTLDLPDLPPGWYQARMLMLSNGQSLGDQSLALVRLADDAPRMIPDPRFGIIATDLPFAGWEELPDILPYLSAGRVKLAVWSKDGDVLVKNSGAFDRLLERLAELGITPTACLVGVPPDISAKIGSDKWPAILKAKKEDWQQQLAFMIARHASHLDRWQLGADGNDDFVTSPAMRAVYDTIYDEFKQLVEKPDLAMPWPAWYDLEGKLPATVALSVPPNVLPSNLPLYIQDLQKGNGHNLSLSLQWLDESAYGRDVQIRDFAQRVIYALGSDAKRIDLPLPFSVRDDGGTIVKQPEELLLIARTLVTTLGNAQFKGKMPIAENVEAFLFDRDGVGILALWDREGQARGRTITLNLGDRPTMVDLFGNQTQLISSAAGAELKLGAMPVFLTNIDGNLAQLRASVGLDQPLMESSFEPHVRKLRFVNPWKQAIGGSLKLHAPAGWNISPPTYTFGLNPGEMFDREVTIEFPYNSFAGTKTITADFSVQADRNTTFSVPVTLTLGLSDVGMQSLALQDGKDVVVQQMITNYGEQPINYTAFSIFPGQARQERLVTNLGPGRTTIKKYRFPNVKTNNAKVRVGVKELDGSRILNEEIAIQ